MAAARESGHYPTGEIANPPELRPWLHWVVKAFDELKSCRQLGFGACGAIPWDSIRRFAEVYELYGDDSERFHELIRYLDLLDLKKISEDMDRQSKNGSGRQH